MIPADWTPHRRPEDRELLGWIRSEGDDWVAVDLLGREVSAPVDWLEAEAALEAVGLAWLGDVWMLDAADGPRDAPTEVSGTAASIRVRIVEVAPAAGLVVVQTDDFGAIDAPVERFDLPWPPPAGLRPRRPGEVTTFPFG